MPPRLCVLKQLPGRHPAADRRPGCRVGEHTRLGCSIDHPVKAAGAHPEAVNVAGQPDIAMDDRHADGCKLFAVGLSPSPPQTIEHRD